MADFIGAVDQGTTSTRFMVFDHDGREVARHQLEHEQLLPRAGWVEHNPLEIWDRTQTVIGSALTSAGLASTTSPPSASPTSARRPSSGTAAPAARSTTPSSGRTPAPTRSPRPSTRDERGQTIRHKAGLPPATYFSAGKVQWILENVDGVREAAERGDALFGTADTWLVWNLTGGPRGGIHATDVTNASRTMLMDLTTLDWDDELLGFFGIPRRMLPDIHASSDATAYGMTSGDRGSARGADHRRPRRPAGRDGRAGLLRAGRGQEHLRHRQLPPAQHRHRARPQRATGCSPRSPTSSARRAGVRARGLDRRHRQRGPVAARPARHHLRRVRGRALAAQVDDTGGVYFVPAFSGLFAPYWRSDARGAIVGLSRFNTNAHLARATLEAICYQSPRRRRRDGSRLGRHPDDAQGRRRRHRQPALHAAPGRRPRRAREQARGRRDDALGAAYAAGLATGFWSGTDELRSKWAEAERWEPQWSDDQRRDGYAGWRKAVERTLDWVDVD